MNDEITTGETRFSGVVPQTFFPEIQLPEQQEYLRNCFQMLSDFTSQSVKYLGPYRQIPNAARETGNSVLDMYGSNVSEVIARWKDKTIFDGSSFAEAFAKWTGELLHTQFVVRVENGQYRIMALENEIEFGLGQIGFGNTQILPIIVQILTAQAGDLVIIENPEVHLHPRWKADLMNLFFHAAAYGIKVVIETQSIEMINRTRLIAKKHSELRDKIALYFLDRVTIDDSFA